MLGMAIWNLCVYTDITDFSVNINMSKFYELHPYRAVSEVIL